jgi:hypothetical protein
MKHHSHPFENKYCTKPGCQCTTRHEVRTASFVCLQCGTVKYEAALLPKTPLVQVSQPSNFVKTRHNPN